MLSFLLWYLLISTLGLLTFPLAYRLLPGLPDRGYALSRIMGLLLWGYLFWLLGSLGILNNDVGGELFALLIVAMLSGWALRSVGWPEIRNWLHAQWRLIITVEILFLVTFAAWAIVRAANPEITGTEKPMELAFINAILRSPTLPPHDPWLSGYAISYYYFGYLLVAMIARLAGTLGGVAFNLGISLVFALSVIGAYSLLYNLLSRRVSESANQRVGESGNDDATRHSPSATRHSPSATRHSPLPALLAPFFALIVSNLGGLLHILRVGGLFWRVDETGEITSRFWAWLDIGKFSQPPPQEPFFHWWWWQASRIVQDFDFNWANKGDVIDEFPFFSYLLADLHPHVLAMPFAFLAMALALNLFFGGGRGQIRWLGMRIEINLPTFMLAAVALGSLAFLNTWDFPFYVALFAGAYTLWRFGTVRQQPPLDGQSVAAGGQRPVLSHVEGSAVDLAKDFFGLGAALGITGILLYLPFYFGFQSQAGGPLPNLIYITRGTYLWIHFAPLLVPILAFLIYLWKLNGDRDRLKQGVKLTLGLVLALMSLTLLLALAISILWAFQSINPEAAIAADAFLGSVAAPSWVALIREGLIRRLTIPGTMLTLVAILSLTIALLWPRPTPETKTIVEQSALQSPISNLQSLLPSHTFALLLILTGALLVLAPEFVFLRDMFGYRINTIFKFYFQVWLMWSIAAAYGVIILWRSLTGARKIIFRVGMGLLLALALIYPAFGLWSKTNGFEPYQGFDLDGTAYVARSNPDEKAAMQWLTDAPAGVVAESVGGSYSGFARMSIHSGQPTVLGWDFHEMQWRGGSEEMGSRRVDIERLYCTSHWDEAEIILHQYNIRYVVVGTMERTAYGAGTSACPPGLSEIKFIQNLLPVFQQGSVTIYEVPGS
ncbi:MAG: hypothetical protein KJ638_00675 [Chloroflexi bacterium]|nr:hypothetical protein [Chloroflexota bacterium]